jgi:glucose uptake protein GlcU
MPLSNQNGAVARISEQQSTRGILAAVAAGLIGGLLLAPMKFASVQGLAFLPSMAVGILIAAPLSLVMQRVVPTGQAEEAQWRAAVRPGVLAGIVWNIGNACSMVSTQQVRRWNLLHVDGISSTPTRQLPGSLGQQGCCNAQC